MERTSEHGGPEWKTVPPPKAPKERKLSSDRKHVFTAHTTADGDLDWQQPPPKKGRTNPIREEEITAGMKVRAWIEADRARRGIPPEGYLLDGEAPEIVLPKKPRKDGK